MRRPPLRAAIRTGMNADQVSLIGHQSSRAGWKWNLLISGSIVTGTFPREIHVRPYEPAVAS